MEKLRIVSRVAVCLVMLGVLPMFASCIFDEKCLYSFIEYVTPDRMGVDASSHKVVLKLETHDSWKIVFRGEEEEAWCRPTQPRGEKGKHELFIEIDENPNPAPRSAVLRVHCNDVHWDVKVEQDGKMVQQTAGRCR